MVEPSCPALVILEDDAFRRSLIRSLDEQHFSVTFSDYGEAAVKALEEHRFRVVIVGLDVVTQRGVVALEHLRQHRERIGYGVLILAEPSPEIRTIAPWADETLLKPVDPAYVAMRARTYCRN